MTSREDPSQSDPLQWTPSTESSTVQLLVGNDGNRRTICNMLTDEFDVETDHSIQDADLYLVEDCLLPTYREELRDQVTRSDPVFCPVVVIQRDHTNPSVDFEDTHEGDRKTPLLVDEFVETPINRQRLVSRLRSLLVRRQQSLELQTQVETLERQERDLRRFERAVEDSGTATAITDSGGVIEYVNSEFEALTGYAESDVLGEPLERFLAEESLETVGESFWRTMTERRKWEGELLIERKNDPRRITDTTITPIRDDSGDGFVVVMPDITPRIEREQLLKDRERELDLLRQILSRYLRHNLRNDLNVIRGYAELLEVTLPEQDVGAVRKIIDTTDRLIGTSETARKYSTLIEQESELAPQNVSAIVRDVVSEAREQYSDVSMEVETPDECYVLARDGIDEAIHGLIDNAARHNTADRPWVRVTVTESTGVAVAIEDNGPGISELELDALDEGGETPLRHSQGIGLWLSKWVIERADGRLSFDALGGGGTRVTIDFPPAERVGSKRLAVSDLKAREQRLRTITQRMTDAVLEVNASWEITYVDEQAESILETDADAIRGQDFWDTFADVRETRFEAVYREVMQSRSAENIEEYYPSIDGWLEVYVYPNFDGGLSLYFRDITNRKEREWELERAYSRMELALSVTNAAVWEWETDTGSVTVHPERHPVFGTEMRTIDDFLEGIHPDDRSRVEEVLETAIETGSPYDEEYRVQTDEGVRWAADYGEVQYDEERDAKRMIGVAREITEQKERERELTRKRELLIRTERIADVGGWEIDADTMDVFWSDSLYEILGVERDVTFSLNDALDLCHEDDRGIVENAFEAALDSGEPFDVEARVRRPGGGIRWLLIQGVPTIDDDDEVVTLRGAIQDVTERKERERALEERIKELTAIQKTAHTFFRSDSTLADVFAEFIEDLPRSFQYPEITAGKITYKDHEASTADFEPRERCLTARRDTETEGTVRIDVVYLEERPPEDDGPFLTEEQELLDTLVAVIGSYVERWEYVRRLERTNGDV